MSPPDDRSNGKSSPHEPRRPDSRTPSDAHRISKDERRSEERIPDERSRFARLENPSPIQNHSAPRIPSGPRGANSMARSTPANPERALITTGSNTRIESPVNPGTDQARFPPNRSAGEFAAPSTIPTQFLNPDMLNEARAIVKRFGDEIRDMTALNLEKEKAKKCYDQKKKSYEKTAENHEAYPEIAEHQNKTRLKAQESYESVERKIAEKVADVERDYELMAIRMISGGVDTSKLAREQQAVRNMFLDFEKRQDEKIERMMKGKFLELDQRVQSNSEWHAQEISSIREEFAIFRATTVNGDANSMHRENQKSIISDLESRLDGQMAKLREETTNTTKNLRQNLDNLHAGPIRSLEQRADAAVEDAKRRNSQREQDHKLLHESLNKILKDSQDQVAKTINAMRNDTVKLNERITALEETTTKLQTIVSKRETAAKSQAGEQKNLKDDITGVRRRVEILESKPSRPLANNSNTGTPPIAKGSPNEEYEVKNEQLLSRVDNMKHDFEQLQSNLGERFERFQVDIDEVYGATLDELKLEVSQLSRKFATLQSKADDLVYKQSTMEGHLKGLGDRHIDDVQGLAAHQTAQWTAHSTGLQNLQKEVQALKANSQPAELPSNHHQNTPGFARQSGSPVVSNVSSALGRQSGSPAVNTSEQASFNSKQINNKLDALEMGLFQLNTRFNNLTTDALARQMWSQLDHVHPHLKDATKGLSTLDNTLQAHDGQLLRLHQKVDGLEKRNTNLPPGLKEALEKVDQNVTLQQNRTDTLELTTRSIQEQVDKLRDDVAIKGDPAAENPPTRSNGSSTHEGQMTFPGSKRRPENIEQNVTTQPNRTENGASTHEGPSNDSGTVKRKAADASNGTAYKRLKPGRRVVQDSDDESQGQGNGLSDAPSPSEQR